MVRHWQEILAEVKRFHSKMRRGKPEMIERLIERAAVPVDRAAEWRAFDEAKFQALAKQPRRIL